MGISRETEESRRIVGSAPLPATGRDALKLKHYDTRTELAYLGRITRRILINGKGRPKKMGDARAKAFLDHPALTADAATQNPALNAPAFLYRQSCAEARLCHPNPAATAW